jgi:hypothetical protein
MNLLIKAGDAFTAKKNSNFGPRKAGLKTIFRLREESFRNRKERSGSWGAFRKESPASTKIFVGKVQLERAF